MTPLKFEDLRIANLERCESSTGFAHQLNTWLPSQWSNAMAGECGEVCNLTKKMDRLTDGTRGNKEADSKMEVLGEKIILEIGDVIIYADLLARRLGLTLEECVQKSFNNKSDEIGSPVKL